MTVVDAPFEDLAAFADEDVVAGAGGRSILIGGCNREHPAEGFHAIGQLHFGIDAFPCSGQIFARRQTFRLKNLQKPSA